MVWLTVMCAVTATAYDGQDKVVLISNLYGPSDWMPTGTQWMAEQEGFQTGAQLAAKMVKQHGSVHKQMTTVPLSQVCANIRKFPNVRHKGVQMLLTAAATDVSDCAGRRDAQDRCVPG